jgi:hypothetical protein
MFAAVHYQNMEIEEEEDRDFDWYECRWLSSQRSESVWRITASGGVAFATQASVSLEQAPSTSWSLGDAIADLLLLLGVARSLWKQSNYYGEARLAMSLNLQNLTLHTPLVSDAWSRDLPSRIDSEWLGFARCNACRCGRRNCDYDSTAGHARVPSPIVGAAK